MFSKSNNKNTTSKETKNMKSKTSIPSIIGSDVTIIGNITSDGEIQLDGTVEGDFKTTTLIIGTQGTFEGKVSAETIIVMGEVSGEIRGRSVRLEKSAIVKGDLFYETISVEVGAHIEGSMSHKENPLQDDNPQNVSSITAKKVDKKSG